MLRPGNMLAIGFIIAAAIVLSTVGVAVVAWLVMLLWNVIAGHFGLPVLTYWVSFAIVFLVSIIGKLLFNR